MPGQQHQSKLPINSPLLLVCTTHSCCLRFCNFIHDGKVNEELTQSGLTQIAGLMPLLSKLMYFTADGEACAQPYVTQCTARYTLICFDTSGRPLHAEHADMAEELGIDRFVAYKGQYVTIEELRQFELGFNDGIISSKCHVEPFGISTRSGSALVEARNMSVINSSTTVSGPDVSGC